MKLFRYMVAMQDICLRLQDITKTAGDDDIQIKHLMDEFYKALTPEQEDVRAQLARIPRYAMVFHAVTILSMSLGTLEAEQQKEAGQMLATLMRWATAMEDKATKEKPADPNL